MEELKKKIENLKLKFSEEPRVKVFILNKINPSEPIIKEADLKDYLKSIFWEPHRTEYLPFRIEVSEEECQLFKEYIHTIENLVSTSQKAEPCYLFDLEIEGICFQGCFCNKAETKEDGNFIEIDYGSARLI